VMAAALVLTVITGIDYVYRALTLRRTSARAMAAAAARRAAAGGKSAPGDTRRDSAA
jgi:CDP-diacylglycerol--glycerol-3-phosphate 3-phosphatidyltransferase